MASKDSESGHGPPEQSLKLLHETLAQLKKRHTTLKLENRGLRNRLNQLQAKGGVSGKAQAAVRREIEKVRGRLGEGGKELGSLGSKMNNVSREIDAVARSNLAGPKMIANPHGYNSLEDVMVNYPCFGSAFGLTSNLGVNLPRATINFIVNGEVIYVQQPATAGDSVVRSRSRSPPRPDSRTTTYREPRISIDLRADQKASPWTDTRSCADAAVRTAPRAYVQPTIKDAPRPQAQIPIKTEPRKQQSRYAPCPWSLTRTSKKWSKPANHRPGNDGRLSYEDPSSPGRVKREQTGLSSS